MKKIMMVAFMLLCMATNIQAQENDPLNPSVREGGYGKAAAHSGKYNLLVIYISGGKGENGIAEKYEAKEYAKLLQAGFKNPKYTNYPTNIVVFYREMKKDRATLTRVLINGLRYETQSGVSTFTPSTIGKYIDVFTKYYREQNGISLDGNSIIQRNKNN